MNPKIKHSLLFIFSLCLLVSTLFVQQRTKSREELADQKFGYPFPFLGQDLLSCKEGVVFQTKDGVLPSYNKLNLKNNECKIKSFSVLNFLASFFAIFVAVEILVYFLEWVDFRLRNAIFKE